MSPQNNPSALAALNGARPVLAHFDQPRSAEDLAADIIDLWTGAENALQALDELGVPGERVHAERFVEV